jgi:hypothetical protein
MRRPYARVAVMQKSTIYIGLRVPIDLAKQAAKIAAQEDRNISAMIRIFMKEAIQARNGNGKAAK